MIIRYDSDPADPSPPTLLLHKDLSLRLPIAVTIIMMCNQAFVGDVWQLASPECKSEVECKVSDEVPSLFVDKGRATSSDPATYTWYYEKSDNKKGSHE